MNTDKLGVHHTELHIYIYKYIEEEEEEEEKVLLNYDYI